MKQNIQITLNLLSQTNNSYSLYIAQQYIAVQYDYQNFLKKQILSSLKYSTCSIITGHNERVKCQFLNYGQTLLFTHIRNQAKNKFLFLYQQFLFTIFSDWIGIKLENRTIQFQNIFDKQLQRQIFDFLFLCNYLLITYFPIHSFKFLSYFTLLSSQNLQFTRGLDKLFKTNFSVYMQFQKFDSFFIIFFLSIINQQKFISSHISISPDCIGLFWNGFLTLLARPLILWE
ncbi:hypothetical protein pb186bvf_020496 [Paramecium bursaria]